MREIRFRAWDGERCRLIYDMTFTKKGISCRTHGGKVKTLINPPIMQFTGLKDKNGTEVYPEDLIHLLDKQSDRDYIIKIDWKQSELRYLVYRWHVSTKEWVESFLSPNLIHTHGTIIGNVYQNGNLLKEPQ